MVSLPPLLLVIVVVLSTLLAVPALEFTSNYSATYNGTYLSAEAWHAQSLTQVSWDFLEGETSAVAAHYLDRVLVFFDSFSTDVLRFGSNTSSSSSSSSTSSTSTSEHIPFPDDMGAGTDICAYDAYVVDPSRPFDNNDLNQNVSGGSQNSSTWWYTSTLGQEEGETIAGDVSSFGSANVLLGDPGIYIVCLVLGEEECIVQDCLKIRVYQPPTDFLQVTSTNIGAVITISFNVVSVVANPGDWGWILGGVDPSFEVADANSLKSGRAYNQFSEGCWFYFGQATMLGHPFLCSRDPDQELAMLQASTAGNVFQYGSFQLYSATAGNVSIWYAIDEAYNFRMIHNYYTCGIHVRTPASTVVNTTSDLVIVGELEIGENCAVGSGIPLRVRTEEVTFNYVDLLASMVFWGKVESVTPAETSLSMRLPVKGQHFIVVELESGGVLEILNITATPGEPYGPTSVLYSTLPSSIEIHSSLSLSFGSRDYYNNEIASGYGDGAFNAWVIQPGGRGTSHVAQDKGDGTYLVQLHSYNKTGTTLLFIQRNGLNIPGSPFETYVYGPKQCGIGYIDAHVEDCGSTLRRTVVYEWKRGSNCDGGMALPSNSTVGCSYIPAFSMLGRTMVAVSVSAALYSMLYLVWITRHRKCMVVRLGQPFVCKLFLIGCVVLNLTGPLYLGKPSRLVCIVRPCVLHIALTFTSSCLYMKTYRVHRLFNQATLIRMSITDRSLVKGVLKLVAVDVIILMLWMIIDGPHESVVRETIGYAEVFSPVCASGSTYFSTILWLYKGGLNAFGVVMAAKTWNCADGVGESQSICLSVYNTTLLGIINLVMHLLVSEDTIATSCARSFAAVGGTVFTVSVVFGPKAYKFYWHGDVAPTVNDCVSVTKKTFSATRRCTGTMQRTTYSDSQRSNTKVTPYQRTPTHYLPRRDGREKTEKTEGEEVSTDCQPQLEVSSEGDRQPGMGGYLPPIENKIMCDVSGVQTPEQGGIVRSRNKHGLYARGRGGG